MWDQDKGNLHKCFDNYFIKVNKIHNYGTGLAYANKLSVNVAVNTSSHGQTMLKYLGPRIFNEIKYLHFYNTTQAKHLFRTKYKLHLIKSYL